MFAHLHKGHVLMIFLKQCTKSELNFVGTESCWLLTTVFSVLLLSTFQTNLGPLGWKVNLEKTLGLLTYRRGASLEGKIGLAHLLLRAFWCSTTNAGSVREPPPNHINWGGALHPRKGVQASKTTKSIWTNQILVMGRIMS